MRKLYTIIFIAIALMVTSCGSSNQKNLERYLNSRYDDTFKYVSNTDSIPGSRSDSLVALFSCKKYPDIKIKAAIGKSGNQVIYSDSYLHVKFNGQANIEIDKVVSSVFNNYYVEFKISDGLMVVDDVDNYTLQDYLYNQEAFNHIQIVVGDTLDANSFELLIKQFSSNNINFTGGVIAQLSDISKIGTDEIQSLIANKNNVVHQVNFSLEDGELTREDWSK